MSLQETISQVREFLLAPRSARLALLAGAGLYEAGETELAVAVWTLGDDGNGRVRRVKDNLSAPAEGRQRSRLADATLCGFLTRLHQVAVDEFEAQSGAAVERVRMGIWPLTHDTKEKFRAPMQRPLIFYMPDLPAAEVEPNSAFPWVDSLEAASGAIRDEYESSMGVGADVRPYVPEDTNAPSWEQLRGSLDWSAIHLYQDAKATPMLERFPQTSEALRAVDLARIDGVPMEVFFSRLKAGAHIPPHNGLTNTRVTVHLPLIVPGDCEIRVGTHLHQWQQDKIFAFDDSFEHEAWNRSDADRVVLIFEAYHPDLSLLEREAIEHAFTVRQRWLDSRTQLIKDWLARK
ncbi:MAG TPA: aspartyl/asparaginyl beta-hydroxylase domain-containing protein [Dokdonella sp.]|uniref:aspartyl/asparaginyl beta-hydroxylase domain-containing protein n=1 Tax=Dokdonella sp. TaxID=2291710 RepID=UPI002D7E2F5D|nr:aspartyl/asparaginyl beta-hydroxylase domain-containing protein [Dokdonella sp.]HET9034372.1 aspartyl/asparaginyl beta-hydroxylase domain-containing protein [Dokdonella sp.]